MALLERSRRFAASDRSSSWGALRCPAVGLPHPRGRGQHRQGLGRRQVGRPPPEPQVLSLRREPRPPLLSAPVTERLPACRAVSPVVLGIDAE